MELPFYELINILNQAGWHYVYFIEDNKRGKDGRIIFYIAPYDDPDVAGVDAMIEALTSTFGLYSYIYKLQDVNNVWGYAGQPVLEVNIPKK